MTDRTPSIRVDGVRYVPVLDAVPGVEDVLGALSSLFWGYPSKDTDGLRIVVTEDVESGESFEEFAETLAAVGRYQSKDKK